MNLADKPVRHILALSGGKKRPALCATGKVQVHLVTTRRREAIVDHLFHKRLYLLTVHD